jgi:ElaB/YqjD/DUF883 family membrane-anchored ribosome-binding protein
MANETEVIREKMEATRNDLSDKLEKLEKQVVGTVQEATSTVADAVHGAKEVVDTVKDTVEGAVEGVKDTMDAVKGTVAGAAEGVRDAFDLPAHMDRHPWLMMGGAVAVGFVAGKLLDYAPDLGEVAAGAAETGGRLAESITTTAGAAASAAGGWMTALEKMFGPEMNKVKELAIGALLGVARDMAVRAASPTMSRQVGEIFDSFTSKLGGKPVEGEVLGPRPSEEEASNGPGRRF